MLSNSKHRRHIVCIPVTLEGYMFCQGVYSNEWDLMCLVFLCAQRVKHVCRILVLDLHYGILYG